MSEFSNTQKEFLENLFLKLNSTIDKKTSELRLEIGEKVKEIKKEITESSNNLNTKISVLEEENKKLKNNTLNLERKVRKNNIAVFGISEQEVELAKSVCQIFQNILGLQIKLEDINDIYRINSNKNSRTPVIVEFISFQTKLLILKNAKQLKGTSIGISNDQCLEDQKRSKILYKHQREARNKGKLAYIKGDKLFISNKSYTIEQLEENFIDENIDLEREENTGATATETEYLLTNSKTGASQSTVFPKTKTKRLVEEEKVVDGKTKIGENRPKENRTTVKTRSNSIVKN